MFRQNSLIFLLIMTFLTSCSGGPKNSLKKSANNKFFDRKGFHGSKRPPLYNKKYITQAKKNILTDNLGDDFEDFDLEDDFEETTNNSKENINMYKDMIKEDLARKQRSSSWWGKFKSTKQANYEITPKTHTENLELKEELKQIKSMLKNTKEEISSYRCPTAKDQEQTYQEKKQQTKTAKEKLAKKKATKSRTVNDKYQPKHYSDQIQSL